MINRILDTELKYIECFCDAERFDGYTRYSDDSIKDMYSHNFTYINKDVTEEAFISIVAAELEHRRANGKTYLKIVSNASFVGDVIERLPMKPDVDHYDYFGTSTNTYETIRERSGANLVLANTPKSAEHGRMVDIVANYMHMTLEFAIRRIDRKFKVYNDDTMPLNLYVCYDGSEPVGNCELFLNDKIAKIEDFDIIEIHQKKRFGSHVLRKLLQICEKESVDEAYLVTDHNDTARDMYSKCGFELIGERRELMFSFDK